MFTIFSDGVCIYDTESPDKRFKIKSPKLKLADNTAGSLTFTVPKGNNGYDDLSRMTSEIVVKRDGKEIWSGRIISEEQDFWHNRKITCEGELGYLNDTSQPPAEYHDMTVRGFLETLIDIHNAKASEDKQFTVGAVTVTDPNDSLYRYTNFESTYECISDKLINRLGGHIRIRKENGVRYIDYLADWVKTNTQTIEFGKNLLDFTKTWDLTDLATVVVPLGERLEESPIEALDAYLTVESVNDGSIYVKSDEAIETYGWIEVINHWDDVTQASNLLTKAQEYLQDVQFEKMELTITAVDMSFLIHGFKTENVNDDQAQRVQDSHEYDIYARVRENIEAIDVLDQIRCISEPHGMDRLFPVKEIDIQIDAPENTQYVLGSSEQKASISASIKRGNTEIQQRLDNIPSTSSILSEAKANADAIMKQSTNGFITTVVGENGSEKLIISDDKDYTKASKYWEWSLNGLAYYKNKENLGLALTMDGAIVADKITSGTLDADIIRTGLLTSSNGNSYWDLDSGEFYLDSDAVMLDENGNEVSVRSQIIATSTGLATKVSAGEVSSMIAQSASSIRLQASSIVVYSTNFSVTEDGIISATNANISGTINLGGSNNSRGALNLYNSSGDLMYRLDNGGLTYYNDNYNVVFGTNHFDDDTVVIGDPTEEQDLNAIGFYYAGGLIGSINLPSSGIMDLYAQNGFNIHNNYTSSGMSTSSGYASVYTDSITLDINDDGHKLELTIDGNTYFKVDETGVYYRSGSSLKKLT